jgi:hypothetical protein
MMNFNCRSSSGNPKMEGLVFSWDPQTGELAGPDAAQVREMSTWGQVPADPRPWAWTLGPEPLKSYTDMAAIVGAYWVVPPELAGHYPQLEDDGIPEVSYTDADGLLHFGRDMLTY